MGIARVFSTISDRLHADYCVMMICAALMLRLTIKPSAVLLAMCDNVRQVVLYLILREVD